MYVIRKHFDRPDPELVQNLSKLPTPNISDALGRQGGMQSRIRPVFPEARLAGPAYTVLNYPKDNLMTHYALKHASPGDIIVVDNGCGTHGSGWGELMSLAASRKGLGGVVIDGTVRDVDELAEIGIPIFASGVTAEGTVKVTPGGINCPINCGGLAISPGDIIIGDNNGVVVVAYGRIAEVLETSSGIKQKEKIIREKVLNGESLYDIFGLEKILGLHPVKFL
jgi:4-hydroxy-4-methyl-2-oxoglutarate aldolase